MVETTAINWRVNEILSNTTESSYQLKEFHIFPFCFKFVGRWQVGEGRSGLLNQGQRSGRWKSGYEKKKRKRKE